MSTPSHHSNENRFPTTRWTMVLRAADHDEGQVAKALESLCQDYRNPILTFVRTLGVSEDDVEDIVHGFFAKFIRNGGFRKVDPEKGKLRTYLINGLNNHIIDEHRSGTAIKRGSGNEHVSIESMSEMLEDGATSEIYDRNWARTVMDQAVSNLRTKFTKRGKADFFETLYELAQGIEDTPDRRAEICQKFGMDDNALSQALSRFKKSLGKSIREVISHTVTGPEKIEEELLYLRTLWKSPT